MSSTGPTTRSSQSTQLTTRRLYRRTVRDYAVWNQLERWCGPQSHLHDGSKSSLVFIEQGVKVNKQDYIKMLMKKVLLWITESFVIRYVFTQDGDPSDTSNLTQKWRKDNLSESWDKQMWALSCPNINPIGSAIWSILVLRERFLGWTLLKCGCSENGSFWSMVYFGWRSSTAFILLSY